MLFDNTHIQSLIYEYFTRKNAKCHNIEREHIDTISSTFVNKNGMTRFYGYCKESEYFNPKIIITASSESYLCYQALSFIAKHCTSKLKHKIEPILLPDIRVKPYDSMQSFYEEFRELYAKLAAWYENECRQILISPAQTLMLFMPNKNLLSSFELKHGSDITKSNNFSSLESLISMLINYGYEQVEIVEMQGEFSTRGDILDIFVPNTNAPIRLSFFDTEIENIRHFDTQTQLCNKEDIESITIYPALFSLTQQDSDVLNAHIDELDSINGFEIGISSVGFWFLKHIGGIDLINSYPSIFTQHGLREYQEGIEFNNNDLQPATPNSFFVLKQPEHFKDMDTIKLSNIESALKLHKDKEITLISPTNALIKNLDSISYLATKPLQDEAKECSVANQDLQIQSEISAHNNCHVEQSETSISQNKKINQLTTIITPYYLNIQSSNKIFISLEKPKQAKRKHIALDLDSLKKGDFVIHSEYGIGIFESMQQIRIMGGLKDFINIKYANDDKLLLPVENLNMIEKYTSFDNHIVKLDRLGKSSFLRLKDSIKEKLLEIANEIIRLQAKRELSNGAKINLDKVEDMVAYRHFEDSRGFELTKDQEVAIKDSLKDMASGKIMDRLLNGDVGFGKTEVAISLCYASVLNGFTNIVLVPTTLLCMQHFESFKERLQGLKLPNGKILNIAKLDRFTTAKQKRDLQESIKENLVHIVIATHAIFNMDIENIGLIVIDEEHKFGVKQKEILKQKSLSTHILSMSATPIPRTLNMAYSKLKSISHLNTPPFYKQESKTFVKIKQDSLIKESIMREMRRGGQIFYIYNNIAKMQQVKSYLLGLLPHLRILMLHSQVSPKDTEKGMIDFLQKNYDLLLCTSIVESGIHIPNANTIIIDHAENFGIADLHQLRGRVGRGKVAGLCYLLVSEDINKDAQKRLIALEKNSYLGSGASLAMHDLEIRGGGNLLGEAQSGHIKQVGFGMYVRMLEETLHSIVQSDELEDSKVDLRLTISAFISDTLIASERMRLDIYRRLSQAKSEGEVREIEMEIEERFGKLDTYTLNFIELILIKTLAMKLKLKSIGNTGSNIQLVFRDGTKVFLKARSDSDENILLEIKQALREMISNSASK